MNLRLQKIIFTTLPAMIMIGFLITLCVGIARFFP